MSITPLGFSCGSELMVGSLTTKQVAIQQVTVEDYQFGFDDEGADEGWDISWDF